MLSLDISIFPVDSDTGLPVLSASVSVIIVSSESLNPLITGVAVNSVLGMAAVKIPFETSFLLVVQAPSYSTVSRPYYSYCSTGSPKCLPFTSNLSFYRTFYFYFFEATTGVAFNFVRPIVFVFSCVNRILAASRHSLSA